MISGSVSIRKNVEIRTTWANSMSGRVTGVSSNCVTSSGSRRAEVRASSTASIASGRLPSSRASKRSLWERRSRTSTASRRRSSRPTTSRNTGARPIRWVNPSGTCCSPSSSGWLMAYMVLAAQFESFVHPFTVLLAMPLSFIGAFGALLLTGKTLSIFSFIGLILLMGLVKKNGILLVDYTNVLRARGLSRREAILQAGPVRLRPILMTTFAMVFGMIPVAFGMGEGAETRAPMGIAVIGGLLTSLFLTLVVVPAAYDLFDDMQGFFKRRGKKKHDAISPPQASSDLH